MCKYWERPRSTYHDRIGRLLFKGDAKSFRNQRVLYVNDVVFFGSTLCELQTLVAVIETIVRICTYKWMRLNPRYWYSKCKCNWVDVTVVVANVVLEQMYEFVYLGHVFIRQYRCKIEKGHALLVWICWKNGK